LVRYWARRILYEAVVHRADAEFALGLDPVIDARTGADGVDEFLANLLDFPWVVDQQRELDRDGQTVHLHATDHDADWLITLDRDGFTWRRATGGTAVSAEGAAVSAEGAAGDLLLLVYGRVKPTDNRFRVIGDSRLLAGWLEKSAL
jgi:MDMPI C-terminal domain